MALAGHIVKRLVLVACGYLLGVLAGLIAIVVIYSALANLPDAPDYFAAMSMSPIVVLLIPPIAFFVVMIALAATAAPALVAALLSEALGLRAAWLHALFGMLSAVGGFVLVSPTLLDGVSASDRADLAIVAASGLVGGFVYWLVAGRDAGFARPLQTA